MRYNRLKTFSALFFLATFVLAPVIALAQVPPPASAGDYNLLEALPGPGSTLITIVHIQSNGFGDYLNNIYTFGIRAAGVLAVLMIAIGGVEYMLSSVPGAKTDARGRITAALGGLAIALVSFLVLQTINPNLVNFSLSISTVKSPPPFVPEAPKNLNGCRQAGADRGYIQCKITAQARGDDELDEPTICGHRDDTSWSIVEDNICTPPTDSPDFWTNLLTRQVCCAKE
jgi:hypothetical protein